MFYDSQEFNEFSNPTAPVQQQVMPPQMAGSLGRGPPPDGRPGLNNGLNEQIPKHSVSLSWF